MSATTNTDPVNGPGVQAYRDAYVPQVFQAPSTTWIIIDAVVLAALLATAIYLVTRHKPARWLATCLGAALAYFGLYRGGCLCPVGATSNVALGAVSPELIGRVELALFLLPLVAALVAGRVFCGAVCPLGAVQHFVSPAKGGPAPGRLHRLLLALPVLVLLATVASAVLGSVFFICRVDPYKPLFFGGHYLALLAAQRGALDCGPWYVGDAFAWLFLALMLVAGWVIPRVFCRYVCPYGVLLGLLSIVAFWRRKLDPARCTECRSCVRACPVGAITVRDHTPVVSAYQCIQCGRCRPACRQSTCG